jgi:hypothetical protein
MRLILVLAILAFHASTVLAVDLKIGDIDYSPSCTKPEWQEIDLQLRKVADTRAPSSLASLAHTYVCGKGKRAEQVLLRSAPRLVTQGLSGSGEEATTRLVETKGFISPHAGRAWGASIQNNYPDVLVSFFVDEACGHTATFRLTGSAWLLVRTDDGCD